MSGYRTEEEQLEAIKRWWTKYSSIITLCLSVMVLIIAGYRYWGFHEAKVTGQASSTYEQMLVAFSNQNIKAVKAHANHLVKNFSNTIYADAAHLTLAKLYVSKDKFDSAIDELDVVAQKGHLPALQQIARLRIARLYNQNKSYDAALKQLEIVNDKSYLSVIDELKGDIYAETGQYKQALDQYKVAMEVAKQNGMANLFLEMKSNDLLALTQQSSQLSLKADKA